MGENDQESRELAVGKKISPQQDGALQQEAEAPVASPCVDICALDDNDICIGCHRSADEITRWSMADNDWRRSVLKKAYQRWKNQGVHINKRD